MLHRARELDVDVVKQGRQGQAAGLSGGAGGVEASPRPRRPWWATTCPTCRCWRTVRLPVAVADAAEEVRAAAAVVTKSAGGGGGRARGRGDDPQTSRDLGDDPGPVPQHRKESRHHETPVAVAGRQPGRACRPVPDLPGHHGRGRPEAPVAPPATPDADAAGDHGPGAWWNPKRAPTSARPTATRKADSAGSSRPRPTRGPRRGCTCSPSPRPCSTRPTASRSRSPPTRARSAPRSCVRRRVRPACRSAGAICRATSSSTWTARRRPRDRRWSSGADDPNVLKIAADNVHFDNDRLLLYTNDRIQVTSQQVEISGRGLSLRWNEDPQELQMLRLEHGDGLVVRNVPGQEEVELLALPTGGTTRRSAVRGSGPDAPRPRPQTMPAAVAVAPPVPRSGHPRRAARARTSIPATFHSEVRVVQGTRYIRGADTLSMEFQWARAAGTRAGRPHPASGLPPPLRKSRRPPARWPPAAGRAPAARADLLERPADRGARHRSPGPGRWRSFPPGHTDTPSRKNVAVRGGVPPSACSTARRSALCREFEFRRMATPTGDRRLGRLVGTPTDPGPAEPGGGRGDPLSDDGFELSETGDTARLEGAGYIVRPASRGGVSGGWPCCLLPLRRTGRGGDAGGSRPRGGGGGPGVHQLARLGGRRARARISPPGAASTSARHTSEGMWSCPAARVVTACGATSCS